MNKNIWYLSLLLVLLLALVVTAAGCITITTKPSGAPPGGSATPPPPSVPALPVIKSFATDPATVDPGKQATLTWEVTGATKVEITPIVGTVPATSTVLVSPTQTTTYTLTATNTAGSSTATVTVNVTAAAGRADLVITDIEMITREIYYTARNQGTIASTPCNASFFVNDVKHASSYVETIPPGGEKKYPFTNYAWAFELNDTSQPFANIHEMRQFVVRACVDTDNVVVESDEANNCRTEVWGEKYTYRFADFAHQAWWFTPSGGLTLPVSESNARGAAGAKRIALEENVNFSNMIYTYPEQVPNGWIKGQFAAFYLPNFMWQTEAAYIELPGLARFTARVGFARDAAPNSQAKFTFIVKDNSEEVVLTQSITAANDGKLDILDVDLNSLKGKKVYFELRVDTIQSDGQCRAVWVDPILSQP